MVEEGTYEIMPYKEIVSLKKEIEELKKKSGEVPSRDLLNSMNNLTKSMEGMLQLFRTAAEEMKAEESIDTSKQLAPIIHKINELSEQNKKIAEGMVAIADMVNEMKGGKKVEESIHIPPFGPTPPEHPEEPPFGPTPPEHTEGPPLMPPPYTPRPRRGPMPPEMPAGPMGGLGEMPPLEPFPPEKPKKAGFFKKLFKKK